MTYRGHESRASLGLRAPRSRSFNITPQHGGVTGHWAGPAQKVALVLSGHTRCRYLWKTYQNMHMDTHGWSDIAYTMGCCQHGYLLAGRGAKVRTAANGTNTGNQNWYAICWIGGQGETPSKDALDAFWAGVAMLRTDGGAGKGINEHSDHKATSCAGTFGDAIKRGEVVVDPSNPTPTPNDPEDDEMMKKGDSGDGVKAYQRRINQWATQAGRLSGKTANKSGDVWQRWLYWGIDGDFGSTTEDAVKEFQTAYDLPATGAIGGVTAGILAMFATGGGGGGLSQADADARYATKAHSHSGLLAKSTFDAHTHDEGATSTPR